MGTTNAGAIGVTVEANNVQFDSSMDKSAATAERSMQRISRAQQAAKNDADRFVTSIQRQVDSFGLSGTALMRYEAQLKGVSDQANPLIDRLERMKDAQAAFAAEASKTTGAAGLAKSFGEAEAASGRLAHGTAGITRELLVLGHEASQGNYKRLGGSLMVLAEMGSGVITSLGAMLVPIVAVGAAVAAFAAAVITGRGETKLLNDALRLTGNAAGITAGQVDSMSRSIAASTGSGIGKARTAIEELVKTGDVGPRLIQPMAQAVVLLEKLTGESSEAIVKDFAKMSDGVAKWAAEHNKQLNFITAAQYAYIKTLEEQGQKETAEGEVVRLLNQHLLEIHPNLGLLERAWKALGEAASGAWDKMKSIGRADTVEQQLDKVGDRIAQMQGNLQKRRGLAAFSSAPEGQAGDTLVTAIQEQAELQEKQRFERRDAALQAQNAAYQKAGIASVDYFSKMMTEAKGATQLTKDLEELNAKIRDRVNAGGPAHLPEDDQIEAYIRHKDRSIGDKSAEKLDTRFKDRLEGLTAEGIKLDAEIKSYDLYGKAVDKARLGVLNLEIAQGKLQGLSPDKIAQLQAAASADDAKDKLLAETETRVKAIAAADKFVQKLTEEANAHAMNARETDLATKLAELDRLGVQKNTAAYARLVDGIEKAVDAKHDQMLVNKLASQQLAADQEVEKINEQIAALRMSTLERQNATIALRIQKQAEKDILADPAGEISIRAAAIKQTDDLTAANTRLYNEQRLASTGADQFFRKYQEEASDAAKTVDTLATQGVKGLEDSLTALLSGQKTNFHTMVDALIQEIIRLSIVKPLLADIFGGLTGGSGGGSFGLSGGSGGGLLGLIGGLFSGGGGGGGGATAGASSADLAGIFGVYAQGTNYVPEDGPAWLHKGEAVVPVAHNPAAGAHSGGGGRPLTVYVQPPQGMDRGTALQHGRDIGVGIRQGMSRND